MYLVEYFGVLTHFDSLSFLCVVCCTHCVCVLVCVQGNVRVGDFALSHKLSRLATAIGVLYVHGVLCMYMDS
jgi:hypothetical protein